MAAGSATFSGLREVLKGAVAGGVVPGGVALCARQGEDLFCEAFGARQIEPERQPASTHTVYDIASLTKAVSTSVLVMQAIASGKLAVHDRVDRYLPEFRGGLKESVTVRHLLCHASGLPGHRPLYERVTPATTEPAQMIALAAAEEPLINRPGEVSVYSDLGFILLGWLIARLMGTELDTLFRRQISEPLGLASVAFVRLSGDPAHAAQGFVASHEVAPTERCPSRGHLVCGEVHDLNAYAMGGVAGHAGLFSDARDLGAIAGALVSAWHGDGGAAALVPREVIREFWRPAGIAGSTWRMGWDGPSGPASQAGSTMSRAAVGHLGFTGCSLWIDPDRALSIVLLTNRVHPTVRDDPRFRDFRRQVHDTALAALGA
jgi:CubicO group peptidase (beta-lactamase class C family)